MPVLTYWLLSPEMMQHEKVAAYRDFFFTARLLNKRRSEVTVSVRAGFAPTAWVSTREPPRPVRLGFCWLIASASLLLPFVFPFFVNFALLSGVYLLALPFHRTGNPQGSPGSSSRFSRRTSVLYDSATGTLCFVFSKYLLSDVWSLPHLSSFL